MNTKTFNEGFFSFLAKTPTPYHAVSILENELTRNNSLNLMKVHCGSWNGESDTSASETAHLSHLLLAAIQIFLKVLEL